MDLLKKWWKLHRTKTLGFLGVIVGAIQMNLAALGQTISPHWQGIVVMVFGVLTAALGFFNSAQNQDPPA
jgi:hypothetical protein